MALAFSSSLATRVYLGATEINLAYFGATQVYTSSAFSAEAQNYFDRLDTAGDTTYVDYKQPLANYIDGLVTLGGAYWDTMESACSYVGVGIQGITVPLRSGMTVATNVNNNFVAADLDVLTGLKGDGSTKYINTGVTESAVPQDDISLSVYVTEAYSTYSLSISGTAGGYRMGLIIRPYGGGSQVWNRTAGQTNFTPAADPEFYGTSRDNGSDYDLQNGSTSSTLAIASEGIGGGQVTLFASSGGAGKTPNRIATYHYGPALNLATLRSLQATLLLEVKILNAVASYFSRLDAAGDTTYVPYKQPLTNYISSLVALGGAYWDDMVSSCSYVGVGIQGITVPLREGMTVDTNVNNNFVAGDLNQLTGLKSDGSTKWIKTGAFENDMTLNDISFSVYVSENVTSGGTQAYIAANNDRMLWNASTIIQRNRNTANGDLLAVANANSFLGCSRSNSANFDNRINGTNVNLTYVSQSVGTTEFGVFARADGQQKLGSAGRLATYHVGPALDLATIEALQDTLITEIAEVVYSPEVVAFSQESGATDLIGLDNLVVYLKQENLYDDFVIYPMKSAQNAGSGSTAYSLGGITTNDMALVNSPTWGASGLAFNGTTQAGRVSDYTGSGSVTLFARISNQTEPVSVGGDGVWGQYDSGASARSALISSYGTSQAAGTSQLAVLRSPDGTNVGLYLEDKVPNWATDSCRVAEWTDGGGRKAWLDKAEETLSLVIGSAQTSRLSTAIDLTFSAHLSSGSLTAFAALTGIAAASYEGVLTTTQRETITDYINAL